MSEMKLPELMQVIEVLQPGAASQLIMGKRPLPEPGPAQLLIKVKAAGVNRADLAQRAGLYPAPPGDSDILGLEIAGEVVAAGSAALTPMLGKSIMGIVGGGGYAEYAIIDATHCLPVPVGMDWVTAAGFAEVFLTAFQAMVEIGAVSKGQDILVHAGASGVGTAAIQLAKQLGLKVAVTVGSAEKVAACLALGADVAVNYRQGDFTDSLKQQFPQGFALIIDPVAGDYIARDLQLLALDGAIVVLAMMGGRYTPVLDLAPMFKKRGRLICSTLRTRTTAYKAKLVADFLACCGDPLQQGTLRPVLAKQLNWQLADQAHQLLASNQLVGKVVLTLDD